MSTMVDQLADVQGDDSSFAVMPVDPALLLADDAVPLEDQYADCELRTRHERTERMIRKAQEQA